MAFAFACALVPGSAAATETNSTNFDSFADGQTITNQVPGMTFLAARTFTPSASRTSSPPRALRHPLACGNPDCTNGAYQLRVDFDRLAKTVTLRAGDVLVGCFEFDCPKARLVGYDNLNNAVAISDLEYIPSSNDPGFPAIKIDKQFSIDAGSFAIDHAILYVGRDDYGGGEAGTPRTAQIDDVSAFMLSPGDMPPPPDPVPEPTITINAPDAGELLETSDAFVSGELTAPAGVASFCVAANVSSIPRPCDQTARLRPTGASNRFSFNGLWLRDLRGGANNLTAWVRDGRGRVASAVRAVRVITPDDAIDLRALSIDITQGIQTIAPIALDAASPGRTAGDIPGPHPVAGYPGAGVTLVREKATVVRLQAEVASFGRISAERIRNVTATLRGFVPGGGGLEELPGSPLTAARMDLGQTPVERQRAVPGASYTFTLPDGWLRRGLTLVGQVNPPGLRPRIAECRDCDANNAFGLRNVSVSRDVRTITVTPIRLFTDTTSPPPAPDVYREWQQISPLPVVVQPYRGAVDVTGIVNSFTGDDRGDELIQVVEDWEDDHEVVSHTRRVIGLHRGLDPGLSQDSYSFIFDFQEAVAQADAQRPLTSAAHELGHQLGLEHAGTNPACYSSQPGESWPDGDSSGDILGFGVDVTPGSGAVGDIPRALRGQFGVFGQPMAGLFEPDPGIPRPGRYFDFMSYCANINADISGNPTVDDTWISTRYWNRLIGLFTPVAPFDRRTARGSGGPTLTVSAIVDRAGSVTIERVEPGRGSPSRSVSGTNLSIVVRNAAGDVVSTTGVAFQTLIRHDGMSTFEGSLLAEVPARGAVLVQVLRDGVPVAQLARSPNVPRVSVRCPGGVKGKGLAKLRWSARDADGGALTFAVDYSADGGRHWNTISAGLTKPSLRVSKALLSSSKKGRLRVRASDGFNEGSGRSCRFAAAGAGPDVSIISLDRRSRVDGSSMVELAGQAFDDRGKRITGKRLRWLAGGKTVARGTHATVPAAVLSSKLRLLARDYRGRAGSAAARLKIKRPNPLFLELTAGKARRGARLVRLKVASSVPARLTVSGRGAERVTKPVGTKLRTVRVPVDPGRRALRLRAHLVAHGKSTDAVLTVKRR